MNKCLSIITLNVNGLNVPIRRHKIAEWTRKHDQQTCCLHETHLRTKNLQRLKVKGWKKKYSKQTDRKKKARVVILISDKTDFKTNIIKRHRMTLHNTQGKNPSRRHKYCKYICTKCRSTQIYKKNLGGLQERY